MKKQKKKQEITDDSPAISSDTADHEKLFDAVRKNIAWSEAIYKQNEKMLRHMRWMSIMSFVRILIFLIPIILGIIYLPAILRPIWEQYQSLIGFSNTSSFDSDSVRTLLEQFSNK